MSYSELMIYLARLRFAAELIRMLGVEAENNNDYYAGNVRSAVAVLRLEIRKVEKLIEEFGDGEI